MEGFKAPERATIELQPATEADIPLLIEIEKSVANTKTYSAADTEEDWRIEFRDSVIYILRDTAGVAVGNISYQQKGPDHIYISGLVIKPEFQGNGFARTALTKLLAQHPEAKRIDLVTHPDGQGLSLYESLGFVVEDRKENYYDDGEPRLVLALTR